VRADGDPIPGTSDRTEYNVLFLRLTRSFPSAPLQPIIGVTIDPMNFELNGARSGYVRPVYATTRSTPNIGGRRDGVAVGFSMRFRSEKKGDGCYTVALS
jgi:hypothetical protein